MINSNKILLAWELYQEKVSIQDIAKHCNKHRSTISKWLSGISKIGLSNYIHYYVNVKKHERRSRQIAPSIKKMVWDYQTDTPGISGYKIYSKLKKRNVSISISKIYKIMKDNY